MSTTTAHSSVGTGTIIGARYRLDRLIGQGASGAVWLATHETIGRPVAIKFLRNEAKQTAAIRFLQEARLAAQVQNRFVVSIFDFGNMPDGTLYMVMEHLHGETFGGRVGRHPAVKVRHLLRLVGMALTGLEAVHKMGIVHRDLKPENIFLVEENGEVFPKLLDFGVSRSDNANVLGPELAKLTATGMTVGTPLFMSPEQARGFRDLDARADIYSMGVILYRVLTGKAPFRETNVLDLLMKVVNATDAPAMFERRPDLGADLSVVVQKAMAPNRDFRYADAAEMRRALELVENSVPADAECPVKEARTTAEKVRPGIDTVLPPTDADPTLPQTLLERQMRRRHKFLVAGGLAGVGMFLAAGLILFSGGTVTTSAGHAEAAAVPTRIGQPVPPQVARVPGEVARVDPAVPAGADPISGKGKAGAESPGAPQTHDRTVRTAHARTRAPRAGKVPVGKSPAGVKRPPDSFSTPDF